MEKNPRYSLRSFAAVLGIRPSALSEILNGKRSISTKVIEKVMKAIELSPAEQKKFLESILQEKKDQGLVRISPEIRKQLSDAVSHESSSDVVSVGLDEFRIIADWYHYAILELTTLTGFKPEIKWIAKRLGISETEAKLAIERLLRLELIERKSQTYVKTNQKITTKDKSKTSLFHRKRQKQVLEKSIQSLEQDSIESRNHSSLTFGVNPARVTEAKARIDKFMWEMSEFLMEGEKENVYELQVSLFPLSRIEEKQLKGSKS